MIKIVQLQPVQFQKYWQEQLVPGAGGAIGFAALYLGGPIVGLNAAGIAGGLAAAGALVGGGMAAGIAVLAAPAVLL